MASTRTVYGYCAPEFESVKKAFLNNFDHHGELGASIAVNIEGREVVNLWGGYTGWVRLKRWQEDTLANIYSGTKALTAICALRLVDKGLLDLEKPVAQYWPAFAQSGKEDIKVGWVLSHRAAVTGVRKNLSYGSIFRWRKMVTALAEESPWWEPGANHGYHAMSFGWLMGQVIKNITGQTVGEYLRDEIVQPLGLDLHMGLKAFDHRRVAQMKLPIRVPDNEHGWNLLKDCLRHPYGATSKAFLNPLSIAMGVNSKNWRSKEIPAANAHCTAKSLAIVYGALAMGGSFNGVEVLKSKGMEYALQEQSAGHDYILKLPTRFSMGFMLNQSYKAANFGPGRRSFGHNGAGGSFAFADPDAKIGFSYLMNSMGTHVLMDPRPQRLINAVYDCI